MTVFTPPVQLGPFSVGAGQFTATGDVRISPAGKVIALDPDGLDLTFYVSVDGVSSVFDVDLSGGIRGGAHRPAESAGLLSNLTIDLDTQLASWSLDYVLDTPAVEVRVHLEGPLIEKSP
jgi:hypothetical protein